MVQNEYAFLIGVIIHLICFLMVQCSTIAYWLLVISSTFKNDVALHLHVRESMRD